MAKRRSKKEDQAKDGGVEEGTGTSQDAEVGQNTSLQEELVLEAGDREPVAVGTDKEKEASGSMETATKAADAPPNAPIRQRNWAEVVVGNRDTSNGWVLNYRPLLVNSTVVTVTPEEEEEACANWKNALIGFVVGAKPRFREMEGYARARWGGNGAPKVHLLQEGIFLFDFSEEEKKNRIMEQNWSYWGHPLILRPWSPELDLSKLDVEKVPVWIKLPNLPLSCWSPAILGKIASCVGIPIATDMLTARRSRLSYARVLVEMKISTTLKYDVPVSVAGRDFMQRVVYEWLPLRCSRCKALGHDHVNCSMPVEKIWVPKAVEIVENQEGEAVEQNDGEIVEELKEVAEQSSKPVELEGRAGETLATPPLTRAKEKDKLNVNNKKQNQKKKPAIQSIMYSNVKQNPKQTKGVRNLEKGGMQGENAVIKAPNAIVDGNQVTVYLPPNG